MATKGKSGTSAHGEHGAAEVATNGNGALPDQGASPSPSRGQGPATIAARPSQFMIAPQQQPGLATFSVDFLTQQLNNSPDIEVVKTVSPPRLFGFQSADIGQVPLSPLVLAKMTPDKAKLLQTQAGERCAVERDERLSYMLDPATPQLPNPGVLTPLADGFTATIEVLGQDGPLSEAEVYVFGSMWPAQGITDATGRATVTLQGSPRRPSARSWSSRRSTTGLSGSIVRSSFPTVSTASS